MLAMPEALWERRYLSGISCSKNPATRKGATLRKALCWGHLMGIKRLSRFSVSKGCNSQSVDPKMNFVDRSLNSSQMKK